MKTHEIRVIDLEAGATILFRGEKREVVAKPTWTKIPNVCNLGLRKSDGKTEWLRTDGRYRARVVVDAIGVLNMITAGDKAAAEKTLREMFNLS